MRRRSGADFDESGLNVIGKKFKDASVFYIDASEINKVALRRWLKKDEEHGGSLFRDYQSGGEFVLVSCLQIA